MLWVLSSIGWAGAFIVLVVTWRLSEERRVASCYLLLGMVVATVASLVFPTAGVATAAEYWQNADRRAFVAMMEDAIGAAVFWGLAPRAKWIGRLGTLFFIQETVYLLYVISGHAYTALRFAEWATFALFLVQLYVVDGGALQRRLGRWWRDWRDDRSALGAQRSARGVGAISSSPSAAHRFPGEAS